MNEKLFLAAIKFCDKNEKQFLANIKKNMNIKINK
jgi:hypothetical protein